MTDKLISSNSKYTNIKKDVNLKIVMYAGAGGLPSVCR